MSALRYLANFSLGASLLAFALAQISIAPAVDQVPAHYAAMYMTLVSIGFITSVMGLLYAKCKRIPYAAARQPHFRLILSLVISAGWLLLLAIFAVVSRFVHLE